MHRAQSEAGLVTRGLRDDAIRERLAQSELILLLVSDGMKS